MLSFSNTSADISECRRFVSLSWTLTYRTRAIVVDSQLRTIEGHIDHYDHSGDQGVSQSANPTISKVRSTLCCGRVRMRVRPSRPI
jgi:hypothetical protein